MLCKQDRLAGRGAHEGSAVCVAVGRAPCSELSDEASASAAAMPLVGSGLSSAGGGSRGASAFSVCSAPEEGWIGTLSRGQIGLFHGWEDPAEQTELDTSQKTTGVHANLPAMEPLLFGAAGRWWTEAASYRAFPSSR